MPEPSNPPPPPQAKPAPTSWGLEPNNTVLDAALAGTTGAISEACRRGLGPELVRGLRTEVTTLRSQVFKEAPPLATVEQLVSVVDAIGSANPCFASSNGWSLPMLTCMIGELEEHSGRAGTIVYGAPRLILDLAGDVDQAIADDPRLLVLAISGGMLADRPSWVPEHRPDWIRRGFVGSYFGCQLVKRFDLPWRNTAVIVPLAFDGLDPEGDGWERGARVFLDTSLAS